jgi:uncharacterized protein involved in exopolysaccharide biosynthesis
MSQEESLLDIVSIVYRNRKKIIYTALIAGVLSAIVSLMMPNYYKSTTLFYPASTDMADPLPVGTLSDDRYYYGTDMDLDRLLSIANSSEMYEYLINKFNLYEHYDINPDSKTGPSKVRKKIAKLYNVQKSKFDAIELSVEDQDREMASNMANEARNKIDELAQGLIKNTQNNLLQSVKSNVVVKELGLTVLTDSLTALRNRYSIYNPYSQGETFGELVTLTESKQINTAAKLEAFQSRDSIRKYKVVLAGIQKELIALKEKALKFNKGYGLVLRLEDERNKYNEQLSFDKERLKQLNATYNAPFAAIHLIQKAEVPLLKSRPKRSILVIGITAMAGILSMLWVLLLNQFKVKDWKRAFKD